MLFAFTVAKHVKSNAIVYARDGQTAGIGAGQMSRVYSARIAGISAGSFMPIRSWPKKRCLVDSKIDSAAAGGCVSA